MCSRTSRSWASIPALQRKAPGERAMAREKTKKGRLGGLQRFRDALMSNREALPHLDGSFTQFDARVTGALELANRQWALTAEKQEISKQLTDALDEAELWPPCCGWRSSSTS